MHFNNDIKGSLLGVVCYQTVSVIIIFTRVMVQVLALCTIQLEYYTIHVLVIKKSRQKIMCLTLTSATLRKKLCCDVLHGSLIFYRLYFILGM